MLKAATKSDKNKSKTFFCSADVVVVSKRESFTLAIFINEPFFFLLFIQESLSFFFAHSCHNYI